MMVWKDNAGHVVKDGLKVPDMLGLWHRFQQTAKHALPQRFANLRCCINRHALRKYPGHNFPIWKYVRGKGQFGLPDTSRI